MKPPHAEFKKVSRCKCCQSKYSKHNAGHKRYGSKMARMRVKVKLKKYQEG